MIMFCGLPVIVATEPMLADVAIPTKYGIGFRCRRRQTSITSGVSAMQTMSLTRNADSTPDKLMVAANSATGR